MIPSSKEKDSESFVHVFIFSFYLSVPFNMFCVFCMVVTPHSRVPYVYKNCLAGFRSMYDCYRHVHRWDISCPIGTARDGVGQRNNVNFIPISYEVIGITPWFKKVKETQPVCGGSRRSSRSSSRRSSRSSSSGSSSGGSSSSS